MKNKKPDCNVVHSVAGGTIKKKTYLPKRWGFTLIELLIIIAIIGILTSVVLVVISSLRKKTKMAEFKATASSLNAWAINECNVRVGGGAATAMTWPAANTTGTINIALACDAGGDIAAGTAESDAGVTGTNCTATMNKSGVKFAAGAAPGGC